MQQYDPAEPPPVKKRRVVAGSSSGTSTMAGSNLRFHNFNDRTRSTAVGSSGSMMITYPLESGPAWPSQPYSVPDSRRSWVSPSASQPPHAAGLLPTDFEHGPTELPPRPYANPTKPTSSPEGSVASPAGSKESDKAKGKSRSRKPTLPDDVMDYVSIILLSTSPLYARSLLF